jgi:hypothetical protein
MPASCTLHLMAALPATARLRRAVRVHSWRCRQLAVAPSCTRRAEKKSVREFGGKSVHVSSTPLATSIKHANRTVLISAVSPVVMVLLRAPATWLSTALITAPRAGVRYAFCSAAWKRFDAAAAALSAAARVTFYTQVHAHMRKRAQRSGAQSGCSHLLRDQLGDQLQPIIRCVRSEKLRASRHRHHR